MSTATPIQKFDITAEEIDALVGLFYQRIRAHPMLGPIFARAIASQDGPEWRAHEARIAAFWRNAIGIDRSYDGNPMQVHRANRDIHPGMFSTWLDLFHMTAAEVLSPEKAANMSALAERIGQSLRYGVTTRDEQRGAPPILR
ncbi:group III truncated hemoglobin [Sinisalibacter lacisalsi]|uniref:Preprotein translocase subunit TatC n=1 Tax=Sinisalibacter lacisalsi TaxID=1526570 RepID=A0ABQ1QFF5_9RHOB|nr:group III truncated hemoglobin [Sinisalibacter lacisalsi]GGD23869.1 preprotein translocase subunit TatC [Sinisalibacter lacisalsi]